MIRTMCSHMYELRGGGAGEVLVVRWQPANMRIYATVMTEPARKNSEGREAAEGFSVERHARTVKFGGCGGSLNESY